MLRRGSAAALAAARRSFASTGSTNHTRLVSSVASSDVISSTSTAFRWALHRRVRAPTSTGSASIGVFCASAAVCMFSLGTSDTALQDAMHKSGVPFDRARAVMEFLTGMGASFPKIEVLPEDPGKVSSGDADQHGLGLFLNRDTDDMGDSKSTNNSNAQSASKGFINDILIALGLASGDSIVIARVPSRLAITAAACAHHPALGPAFTELLETDAIDERMAVMLLLIMEKRRGAASPIADYLDALPNAFHTPLFYDDEAMRGLDGTNLHSAVLAQRKQLNKVLVEYVRPAGGKLVKAMRVEEKRVRNEDAKGKGFLSFMTGKKIEKVSGSKIMLDEFRWAYACFWSRALALPIGNDPMMPTVEAIVPGIDFANHSSMKPNARWRVTRVNGANKNKDSEQVVELVCEPGSVPGPGAEVKISYGDKPNEELLFIHGFAERDNPSDKLVLRAPAVGDARIKGKKNKKNETPETKLALEIQAESNTARVHLMKLLGLPAQVILPAQPPKNFNEIPSETKTQLAVWGVAPNALDEWLRCELEVRLSGMNGDAKTPMDENAIHSAALTGLKAAIGAQTERLTRATAPGAGAERHIFGEGVSAQKKAGTKSAIKKAVAASQRRRIDEVVAADPLAPNVQRQAATYRAGVRRMTRAYEDAVAKWSYGGL